MTTQFYSGIAFTELKVIFPEKGTSASGWICVFTPSDGPELLRASKYSSPFSSKLLSYHLPPFLAAALIWGQNETPSFHQQPPHQFPGRSGGFRPLFHQTWLSHVQIWDYGRQSLRDSGSILLAHSCSFTCLFSWKLAAMLQAAPWKGPWNKELQKALGQ